MQILERQHHRLNLCAGDHPVAQCRQLATPQFLRRQSRHAVPLWDPMYRAFWVSPEDLYVASLLDLSRTLLCLGYVDQARLRRDEALAEARRISPYNRVFSLGHAWWGNCH